MPREPGWKPATTRSSRSPRWGADNKPWRLVPPCLRGDSDLAGEADLSRVATRTATASLVLHAERDALPIPEAAEKLHPEHVVPGTRVKFYDAGSRVYNDLKRPADATEYARLGLALADEDKETPATAGTLSFCPLFSCDLWRNRSGSATLIIRPGRSRSYARFDIVRRYRADAIGGDGR